jgi:hypothetical protein
VHSLIAQGPSGAWNSGAAILTFVFPMLLFIAVAGALYILYTKPEVAPGHRSPERPISYTSIPGQPTVQIPGQPTADRGAAPAADRGATPAADHSESVAGDGTGAAGSENIAPKGDE